MSNNPDNLHKFITTIIKGWLYFSYFQTFIQRTTGCDHMACSQCGTSFCYLCGERFRSLKFFGGHFNRLSVFGCKFRLMPENPGARRFIRGLIFSKYGKDLLMHCMALRYRHYCTSRPDPCQQGLTQATTRESKSTPKHKIFGKITPSCILQDFLYLFESEENISKVSLREDNRYIKWHREAHFVLLSQYIRLLWSFL